jgi:hypothetical protein
MIFGYKWYLYEFQFHPFYIRCPSYIYDWTFRLHLFEIRITDLTGRITILNCSFIWKKRFWNGK